MTDRKFLVEQCKLATLEAITSLGGRASRAEIHDRALRDGGFTEKQLALPGPPRQPRYPTLVGYYLSWSLSWLKKDGELVREGNAVWALADAAKPAPVADELAPVVIDVAARHAQLTHARRRRWPWSRHAA